MQFPFLFRPGQIGGMTLKNRVVMSPIGLHCADADGSINARACSMYEERAKGGVGMIIVGMLTVDPQYGIAIPGQFYPNTYTENSFHILADTVHAYGTKIIGQLYHGGNMCSRELTGNQTISSSDVPTIPGNVPRSMTIEEIKELREKYTAAAVTLQYAEFDGVEIHAANGYLLAQFLSPYYNRRRDQYGGSFENRFRFLKEIVTDIRKACGRQFQILVRFSGDEMCSHLDTRHLTLKDGVQIAQALEALGEVDALDISCGNAINQNGNCEPFSYPSGWKKDVAKTIRQAVTLPVIATNTVKEPSFAETLLKEGVSDFVSVGRGLLADPYFVKKAWEKREEEIRRCIGCMYCRSSVHSGGLQCAVNPQLLRENQFGSLKQNGMGRRIVVVGAGPAGLQCAVTLAKRRFSVVLLEKEEAVGGALRAAAVPPCKDKISGFIETLRMQAAAHNVRIITGADASPELVESYSPEAIFLAVGGSPLVPPIPGAGEYGQMPQDVLLGKMTLEGEVTVVGSGMTGLETAETLAERGSQITLVEMQDQIGPDMSPVLIADIMTRLGPKNPRILTSCQLTGLREKTVLCKNLQTGEELEIYADHVVLAMGVRPDREYIREFTEYFGAQKVFRIGDCEAPGNIYHAVKSGFLKAAVYQS